MRTRVVVMSVLVVAVACVGALLAQGRAAVGPDGEWPMYNRDLAGTRYSPLQIGRAHV